MLAESLRTVPLILVPNEILLYILTFLDMHQVIVMRQTCRRFLHVTEDQSLWVGLRRQQQWDLPLSPTTGYSIVTDSADLSSISIESEVKSTHLVAQSWTQPRKQPPVRFRPEPAGTLVGLELFLDRWLLCVYSEGHVHLFDILPANRHGDVDSTITLCASLDRLGEVASFAASLDNSKGHILFAVSRASLPWQTHLYRIELRNPVGSACTIPFIHLRTVSNAVAEMVRTIEPRLQLMVLSSSYNAHVVRYSLDHDATILQSELGVTIQTENLDETWNGITGARIMGPYIVILKLWSLEFHPLNDDQKYGSRECLAPLLQADDPYSRLRGLPILKHYFHSITFRHFSFSDCRAHFDGSQENVESVQFDFFGYDSIQGIFRYDVRIRFLQTSPDLFTASPDLKCVGVYPSSYATYTRPSGILQVEAASRPRGFVCALALGPQGKRAVWVERRRGSTLREVLVCEKKRRGEDDDNGEHVMIGGHSIYHSLSYDLREDMTHCAIAEISGQIVLGNRVGDILVLKPEVRS